MFTSWKWSAKKLEPKKKPRDVRGSLERCNTPYQDFSWSDIFPEHRGYAVHFLILIHICKHLWMRQIATHFRPMAKNPIRFAKLSILVIQQTFKLLLQALTVDNSNSGSRTTCRQQRSGNGDRRVSKCCRGMTESCYPEVLITLLLWSKAYQRIESYGS